MRELHAGDRMVAWLCAAVAVLAGLSAQAATEDGSLNPSALVKISTADPIAPLVRAAQPGFHFVTPYEHYDGTYYYAIARDPFLLGRAHTLIDQAPYRYGHPLNGWLAGIISGGQAREVPLALMLLSLLGLAVAGWAVSRLAVALGRTPWAGLVVAVSPGLLYAATVSTTETVGAALVALAFLAWTRARYGWAVLAIAACCLDKEQYVAVPIGLAVWELVEMVRHRRPPPQVQAKVVAVVLGPMLLALWYVYVHTRLGAWPWTYQPGNLGEPFAGWAAAFRESQLFVSSNDAFAAQIGGTSPVYLVAVAVLLVLAAIRATSLSNILDASFLVLAVITACQGVLTLVYPHELYRTTAIAVLLALGVLAAHRGPPPDPAADGRADRAERVVDDADPSVARPGTT